MIPSEGGVSLLKVREVCFRGNVFLGKKKLENRNLVDGSLTASSGSVGQE